MSNVTVEATEGAVEVDVVLGSTLRKSVVVDFGESADFVVDGGQTLTVRKASSDAPEAVVVAEGADVKSEAVVAEDGEVKFDPNAVVSDEEAAAALASESVVEAGAALFADQE